MPDDLDRDLAGDADDGRFLRAFDRLAGPPPDPLAALAALHRRAGPTATRRGPRLAVGLAAAAVTLAFLAAVGHRGDDHQPSVTARPVVTAAEARVLDASTTSMPITVDASAASTPVPATAGSTTRDPSPAGTDPDGSPGATVDSGTIEARNLSGGSTLVPLTFTGIGFGATLTYTNAGGRIDELELNGTPTGDIFNVNGSANAPLMKGERNSWSMASSACDPPSVTFCCSMPMFLD